MTNFLERLVGRAQGGLPVVQPRLPSRHAPGVTLPAAALDLEMEPLLTDAEEWPGETPPSPESEESSAANTAARARPRPRQPVTPPAPDGRTAQANAGDTDGSREGDGRPHPDGAAAPDARSPQPATRPSAETPARPRGAASYGESLTAGVVTRPAADSTVERATVAASAPTPAGNTHPPAARSVPPEPRQQSSSQTEGSASPATGNETMRPAVRRAGASPVWQAAADIARLAAPAAGRTDENVPAPRSSVPPVAAGVPVATGDAPGLDLIIDTDSEASATAGPESGRYAAPPSGIPTVPEGEHTGVRADRRRAAPVAPRPGERATTVRVTIGRIEVRAVQPASPPLLPQSPPAEPVLALDAYLKQRSGERA